ncbi:MAG: ABC transporter ATP-binding protein [Legionellales bacterium]|nr:ABC transporter ATP-binding protein [Legionellales bacterium]
MISVRNVSKFFGSVEQTVLHNISFEIKSGELVSLTGRSGSGKSTLLYIISTLDFPSTGDVIINDYHTQTTPSAILHAFRNRHIGFVFQFHYLLTELTALENILMPARKYGIHQQKATIDYAYYLLNTFNLAKKAQKFPAQMSGGEQQRIAIARALIMQPQYIFADEPTGNLDSANGQVVMDIFRQINREQKTTIVYVTHDVEFAKLAERQIVLVDGKLA